MAIVNKFNVNKQQVTLDPNIIENMSANDVSYDDSTQYNENTVGDKLNKLSELGQKVFNITGGAKEINLSTCRYNWGNVTETYFGGPLGKNTTNTM